jgi:hypothetical protein
MPQGETGLGARNASTVVHLFSRMHIAAYRDSNADFIVKYLDSESKLHSHFSPEMNDTLNVIIFASKILHGADKIALFYIFQNFIYLILVKR